MENVVLICPECGSEKVTTAHIEKFMVNTGEHYCHSVKTHDPDSPANCLDCRWTGERDDLTSLLNEEN